MVVGVVVVVDVLLYLAKEQGGWFLWSDFCGSCSVQGESEIHSCV